MPQEKITMVELRQANMEIVQRFISALNDSWNMKVLREIVSEDFVFELPFAPDWFPSRYEGRETALAFLDSVRELMDPENLHDLRVDTYAKDPSEVVTEYKSATRIKLTNLPYRNRYIGRFTVRDGKIAY